MAQERKKMHLTNLVGNTVEVFMERQNKGHTNQFAPIQLVEKELKHSQTIKALVIDSDENFAYAKAI